MKTDMSRHRIWQVTQEKSWQLRMGISTGKIQEMRIKMIWQPIQLISIERSWQINLDISKETKRENVQEN
jgi:hypothetical protein